MRLKLTIILGTFFVAQALSQNSPVKQNQIDSLRDLLAKDSAHIFRKTIAKPYLRLENRNSFISKEAVNLFGFLAGATFYERHILCAGYYFLDRRSKKPIQLIESINTNYFLRLSYFNLSYQYVLFNWRYTQINIPLEVGYGRYGVRVTDSTTSRFISSINGNIIPVSGGLQFILKPVKWAGFSLIGGYRYAKDKNLSLNFNGWYYSVGVWVDARQLLRNGRYYLRKKKYRRDVGSL